jgi:Protein of unknown function (DUF2778)
MTLGARHYFVTNHSRSLAVRQAVCRTSALAATAFIGASFLTALCASPPLERSVTVQAPLPSNSDTYWAVLDTRFEFYFSPNAFSESISVQSDDHPATAVSSQLAILKEPNIATTPPESSRALQRLASGQHPSHRMSQHAALSPNPQSNENSPDDSTTTFDNFFTKLFRKTSAALTLAYAAPDQGPLNDGGKITDRHDQWTAVYDISAHTVYMPDGTKLEAHSGLGTSLDDPRHVDEKNRGPTPPNVYDLELREQPFHGVSALRLIPVDEKKALGRTGLLAHSFLLGPDGQSNGCVSFRDYDAFLRAYSNHQIKRLVVVARLD